MRYICRLNGPRAFAWRVQYVRGLNVPIQVYFTDAAYGGRDQALQEAIRFRDQVVALHAPTPPRRSTAARRNLRFNEKTEEYVGISLLRQVRQGGGVAYTWSAKIKVDGLVQHKSWSVRKHGYSVGFRRASEYRHRMTGQPLCLTPPPPPDHLLQWARINGVRIETAPR